MISILTDIYRVLLHSYKIKCSSQNSKREKYYYPHFLKDEYFFWNNFKIEKSYHYKLCSLILGFSSLLCSIVLISTLLLPSKPIGQQLTFLPKYNFLQCFHHLECSLLTLGLIVQRPILKITLSIMPFLITTNGFDIWPFEIFPVLLVPFKLIYFIL